MNEEQLKAALIQAHNKGDKEAAQLFANKIKELRAKPEPSFGERVGGAFDAAATMATGAIAQPVSGVVGLANLALTRDPASAAARVEQVQNRLTYQPSELGQEYLQNIANAPIIKQIGEASQGAGEYAGRKTLDITGSPALAAIASGSIDATGAALGARASMPRSGNFVTAMEVADGELIPSPPAGSRNLSAAQVEAAEVRQNRANELPIRIQLTKGQATQDFGQQRFERETAKSQEGERLRQRFTEQNQAVSQNIDAMLDMTGTKIGENAYQFETGNKVIKALELGYKREKSRVDNAYKAARARGETQEIIIVPNLADYLKENVVDVTVAPVVGLIAREAERLGIASGKLEDGSFHLKPMTVEQSETLRQRVNALSDQKNGQDMRRAGQIKSIIDQAQEQASGKAFQSARKMRTQLANKYENLAIVDQLLDTKGSYIDQRIAAENVVNRAIIGGSVEDVVNLRRVLTTAGDEGLDAWNEVRAATLRYIRDEVTKNVGRDPLGNPLISAPQFDRVIKSLEQNKKLDLVFGKKYAAQLSDLRDIVRDIYVSQPNAVNQSNTASVLLAAMDIMVSGVSGVPAPILSGLKMIKDKVKDRSTQKKITEALQEDK